MKNIKLERKIKIGAGNGAQTRDLCLGKAALYQLSYSRNSNTNITEIIVFVKYLLEFFIIINHFMQGKYTIKPLNSIY